MRWTIRLIGLVSTVILARLLTPEDFGVVAMGTLALTFLDRFMDFGISQQIIRKQSLTDADCNTGWTLQLLQHVLIAAVMSAFAYPIADFFSEPRLVPVLWVLAASFVLGGLRNIGMVLARKELDFAKDFRFNVYEKLSRFVTVVPFAFLLGNYWALVLGQIVSQVFTVAISFRMHEYRPRLSLASWRDFVSLGIYVIPIQVARFLRSKIDVIFVGRIAGTSALGAYNLASDLAGMATQEIVYPIGRALAPSYAKLLDEPDKLREACLNVIAAISCFAVPVALGLCMVAEEVVLLVLGDKWQVAIPFLQWLSVYGALNSISRNMTGSLLIVTGHERLSALAEWLAVAIILPCVLVGGWIAGVDGILRAITAGAALLLPISALILSRTLGIRLRTIAAAAWPPILAGLIMVSVLALLVQLEGLPLPIKFACEVLGGAFVYVAALFMLWIARGRPIGVERAVLTAVLARWASMRGRS